VRVGCTEVLLLPCHTCMARCCSLALGLLLQRRQSCSAVVSAHLRVTSHPSNHASRLSSLPCLTVPPQSLKQCTCMQSFQIFGVAGAYIARCIGACVQSNLAMARFMAKHGLKTYQALEVWYVRRLLKIAGGLNRTAVLWQEMFDDGLRPPDASSTVFHVWKLDLAEVQGAPQKCLG
jgi:hypothetical protein